MEYSKQIVLKDGRTAILRHGVESDGAAVFEQFNQTHGETDYLLSYPDENSFNAEQEGSFLKRKAESDNEVEIIALVDGRVVATAGVDAIGAKYKLRHRAEFGISVLKEYWGLGIGSAMLWELEQAARSRGIHQLELEMIEGNERAMSLYRKMGFSVMAEHPDSFILKDGSHRKAIFMRKIL